MFPRLTRSSGVTPVLLALTACTFTVAPGGDAPAMAVVVVSPDSVDVPVGDSHQMRLDVTDGDGRTVEEPGVVWSNTNTNMADISESGLLTVRFRDEPFLRSLKVFATVDDVTDTAIVVMISAPAHSLTVEPQQRLVRLGDGAHLNAAVVDPEGRPLEREVTWESRSPSVVAVEPSGRISGLEVGTAWVTATSEGLADSASVTVADIEDDRPAAAVVVISPDSVDVPVGDSHQMSVAVTDENGETVEEPSVVWSNTNTNMADVSGDGLLTIRFRDEPFLRSLKVFATVDDVTDTAIVVMTSAPAHSLTVQPGQRLVLLGDDAYLDAEVLDPEGRELEREVTWESRSPSVVTVDADGRLSGLEVGTTWVTATSEGLADSASVTVTNIDVDIDRPDDGDIVGDEFEVRASVESHFQIVGVTATLGGTTTPLAHWSGHEWRGDIDIGGEPYGVNELRVVAEDVFGGTQEATILVDHDPPPTLEITSPAAGSATPSDVRITATCTDPGAQACANLVARIPDAPNIVAGSGSIDEVVSLAPTDDEPVIIRFVATDSAGQITRDHRTVWVLGDADLTPVVTVPGWVIDWDGERTLYVVHEADRDVLRIRDAAGNDVTIYDVAGREIVRHKSGISPVGAIFVSSAGSSSTEVVHEYRHGALSTLLSGRVTSLTVAGDYAAWLFSTDLFRRDLVSGFTSQMATGVTGYGLTENGDVTYSANYDVFLLANGGASGGVGSGELWNGAPTTDGSVVVWRRSTPCCVGQTHSIVMASVGQPEIVLREPGNGSPSPGGEYQASGRWVAFSRIDPNPAQIWTRSPAGEIRQATFFGSRSTIEALAPDGTLVFASGGNRYKTEVPYAVATPLGSDSGFVVRRNGEFAVFFQGSVLIIQ